MPGSQLKFRVNLDPQGVRWQNIRIWLFANASTIVRSPPHSESNPETKKKDVVWFALDEDRPLFAFPGMWTSACRADRSMVT